LRPEIYKLALVLQVRIDLLSDTGYMHNFSQRRNHEKFIRPLFNRDNINLGLPRACKQVNRKAAEVFHGQNEFQISGTNGCIVAAAFMFTIKARHTRWLTHMNIAMLLYLLDSSRYAHTRTILGSTIASKTLLAALRLG
jgi:hypothetical protein